MTARFEQGGSPVVLLSSDAANLPLVELRMSVRLFPVTPLRCSFAFVIFYTSIKENVTVNSLIFIARKHCIHFSLVESVDDDASHFTSLEHWPM